MDDFTLDTPTFVTLASEMKMRTCEVFWCRVHVQLICSNEPSQDQFRQYSAVLCVRRRRCHGCLGSSSLAISLDRRMHPVRMLSTKAKDARKLMIGIEYGWRSRHVWFRAPNSAVYEQWNDVIRAALQDCGRACDAEESLAKWVERSGISMMETAATSAVCSVDRFSSDSYARGCSSSYRSDIPDDEWSDSEIARRGLYLRGSSADDTGERRHRIDSMSSLAARHRSNSRERTDTLNWIGRPAFCYTGPDNMRYEGQAVQLLQQCGLQC
ncbi:Alpha-ketoglutarate-dependent dioxygenase alkB 6 [Phytophthora cinnamomi]|uniref:Alpha-ketoglutarate-dependent dioxygenase alkB 6 n=1 Tax=Phytophthora cinnamomi TaxID=4785 RepID=UPI00355A7565|nr:Alpha-ketoglutarate-dependent dioxygenase alkB 6 [Phytophthora cinnamomi]